MEFKNRQNEYVAIKIKTVITWGWLLTIREQETSEVVEILYMLIVVCINKMWYIQLDA